MILTSKSTFFYIQSILQNFETRSFRKNNYYRYLIFVTFFGLKQLNHKLIKNLNWYDQNFKILFARLHDLFKIYLTIIWNNIMKLYFARYNLFILLHNCFNKISFLGILHVKHLVILILTNITLN